MAQLLFHAPISITSIVVAQTSSRTCAILFGNFCVRNLGMRMKNKNDAIPVVHNNALIYRQGRQDTRLQVGTPYSISALKSSACMAFLALVYLALLGCWESKNREAGYYAQITHLQAYLVC
jgi:hypothetical protein